MKWLTVRRNVRDTYLTVRDTLYQRAARAGACEDGGLLLVRLDGIGDFFLWLSAARILRETYADLHITLVAEAVFSEYASTLPYFDEVIPVDRRRLADQLTYRREIFDRIRLRRYDLAINPCYTRAWRFRDAEAVMRMARAARKIGSSGEGTATWQHKLSRRWYTELVPATNGPLHELYRNAEFLRGIGIHDPSAASMTDPGVSADPPVPMRESYYVLVPGAGAPMRQWPPERFARIAERITKATGWSGVLCGGPDDALLVKQIRQQASVPLIDFAGKTSLGRLVEILRGAHIVVGNETGALHMAAAVGTPGVSITGGGHYGRFVPYPADSNGPAVATFPMPCFGCDWKCIYPVQADEPAPCVAGVSLETVWAKIDQVLRVGDRRYDQRRVTVS